MSSTFTGPIRIGTRSTTSNDGTISPDTYGAAVCSREVTVVAGDDAVVVLPAGSIIHFAQFFATTTDASRDIDLDGVVVGSVATSAAVNNAVFTDAAIANTGTADAVVTALAGIDNSAGTFSVIYTARNADGTITPYGQGYTNS